MQRGPGIAQGSFVLCLNKKGAGIKKWEQDRLKCSYFCKKYGRHPNQASDVMLLKTMQTIWTVFKMLSIKLYEDNCVNVQIIVKSIGIHVPRLKLFAKVVLMCNQGQRLKVTDHRRYTCTRSEIVYPNCHWDITRAIFMCLMSKVKVTGWDLRSLSPQ